jgi:hypothetical protein
VYSPWVTFRSTCALLATLAVAAIACSDDASSSDSSGAGASTGVGAGNSTSSSSGAGASGGVPSGVSFEERCGAPEVMACYAFDASNDVAAVVNDSGFSAPAFDGAMFAEGGGALQMDVVEGSGPDTSGSATLPFDGTVGVGETLYLQWRQRFSASFIDEAYDANGWKQLIIHENTSTAGCSDSEIVVTNDGESRDFPIVYHACNVFHAPRENPVDGNQFEFDLQPGGDTRCLYSWIENSLDFTEPSDDVDEVACIAYHPDEWMTFQVGVHLNEWCTSMPYDQCPPNSRIQLWVAREGEPSVLVIDWPIAFYSSTDPASTAYDSVQLTPYNTNKNPGQSHAPAEVWYDSVIISKARIADP